MGCWSWPCCSRSCRLRFEAVLKRIPHFWHADLLPGVLSSLSVRGLSDSTVAGFSSTGRGENLSVWDITVFGTSEVDKVHYSNNNTLF